MKLLSGLFLSLLFISPCYAKKETTRHHTDSLRAITILNRSENAYTRLKIYLDSGKVVEAFYNNAHPHKVAKLFKTAYSNTNFNFEYYVLGNSNSLYIVNRSAKDIKSWWGISNQIVTPASMGLALVGAAGVSSRTSTIIPGLLLTNELKGKLNIYHTITHPEFAGAELINGISCYKIKGADNRGQITIWLAKKDLLIRKVEAVYQVNSAKTKARMRKIDSTIRAKNAGKNASSTKSIERSIALMDSVNGKSARSFDVRDTYLFFPYTAGKVDPKLFKFRPNREIAL